LFYDLKVYFLDINRFKLRYIILDAVSPLVCQEISQIVRPDQETNIHRSLEYHTVHIHNLTLV